MSFSFVKARNKHYFKQLVVSSSKQTASTSGLESRLSRVLIFVGKYVTTVPFQRHYSIRNFFYGKDTCINMVADEDDLYIGVVFHEHLVERREITEAAVILDHDRPIGSTCTCVSLPQTAYTSKKSN